ncbi:hypothetical protein [Pelomonas cellulosilytica]|uniref:Uncharacterized protein n=1 Tax=Pelomonas cellulosilytica TaxID=2906762 RepID=A0ABS8XNY5_9BURK|nr:hypothetical protein [Pelomonas sp. P8]MCE4553372.1 hypothetical protein [Pelomonas sp. P8]
MSAAVPDRIQQIFDERVTDFAQAAQRHFKTNDLVVVLDFREDPAQLEAVDRQELVAADELSLDLKLKLSRPASELQEVHGSPEQSFWFIVIFDDEDAECGAVSAAMLAQGDEG